MIRIFRGQLFRCKESEDTEAVAHIDTDDALFGKSSAAVISVPGLSCLQGAAMDIDNHRQFFMISGRTPNIEIEAVLTDCFSVLVVESDLIIMIADDLCKRIKGRQVSCLHGHRREGIALTDAFPVIGLLRFFPSQFAHRRFGIRDAGKQFCLSPA